MKLDFSNEDLQILNYAIGRLPYFQAAPLIAKINKQIQDSHNESVDARDMPSGAVAQGDQFAGD